VTEIAQKIESMSLPENWTTTKLKNISDKITKGSTPTSYGYSYKTEGIKFVKTENIDENSNVFSITNYIDEETNEFLKRSILHENDLLFSIAGTIGRIALIKKADLPANTNQALAIIRTLPRVISHKYLLYYLKSDVIQKRALKRIVGVGRANLSLKNVGEFEVPIAPENEQKRIVAEIEKQFSRLDEAVGNPNRVKANLKRYKASVLKAAVEGKLTEEWRKANPDVEPADKLLERILAERCKKWEETELAKMKAKGKMPKDDKWKKKYKEPIDPIIKVLPLIPENWTWATPMQLAEPVNYALAIGPFGSNLKVADYRKSGMPLIFVRNIRTGKFNYEDTKYVSTAKAKELAAHQVQPGDVLITKMGDPPGDACLYPLNQLVAIITADCIKWSLSSLTNTPDYFVHAVNSEIVKNQIIKITKGVAQQKVSLARFKGIAIPLPPVAEQLYLAMEIERRLSIASGLELEIDKNLFRSDRLRQSTLQMAFSGKLVSQDPNDEPAKELINRIRQKQIALAEDFKDKRRKKVAKKKKLKRYPVIDVLKESNKALSTAQLVERAGYPKNADPETIEPFYLDLKIALETNKIEVQRKGDFDYFKMKRLG
jgi:type I restriction enzyme, S subunit